MSQCNDSPSKLLSGSMLSILLILLSRSAAHNFSSYHLYSFPPLSISLSLSTSLCSFCCQIDLQDSFFGIWVSSWISSGFSFVFCTVLFRIYVLLIALEYGFFVNFFRFFAFMFLTDLFRICFMVSLWISSEFHFFCVLFS